MEEEDNYEEDQRQLTGAVSGEQIIGAAQTKTTPRTGQKLKSSNELTGDIYQATNQPINEQQMSRGSANSYDEAIAMGYMPNIMAVPPLISSEELDLELFSLFDTQNIGQVDAADVEVVGRALGWRTDQIQDLVYSIDPNQNGKLLYEEFIMVVRYIEERQVGMGQGRLSHNPSRLTTNQAPNNPIVVHSDMEPPEHTHQQQLTQASQQASVHQQLTHASQMSQGAASNASKYLSETDRRMYDVLLPKQGVYFLPDEKLIAFLKVINELRKRCEKQGEYQRAKNLRDRFEQLSQMEGARQTENMRIAQEQELATVEGAQKLQFTEFNEAWDKYMADYEAAAFESVEQLKERHVGELQELSQRVASDPASVKTKWSSQLLEMRRQEKIFFSVKDYEKAEQYRQAADGMEAEERMGGEQQLQEELLKQERNLRKRQQMALATLLKRIQRDREEQLKHRFEDAQRLMKRNSNLLKDMLKKQSQEQRKTGQFLKYALGKREVKTDEEIMQNLKMKVYQPYNDPLMPRIAKKFSKYPNPSKSSQRGSTYLNSLRGATDAATTARLLSQDSQSLAGMNNSFVGKISTARSPNTQQNTLGSDIITGGQDYLHTSPADTLGKRSFNLLSSQKRMTELQQTGPGMVVLANKAYKNNLNQQRYQHKVTLNVVHEATVRKDVSQILSNMPYKGSNSRKREMPHGVYSLSNARSKKVTRPGGASSQLSYQQQQRTAEDIKLPQIA